MSVDVTVLLKEIRDGHASAADRLLPLVYDELLGLARAYFRGRRANHTLQPTALVHEAYLRLVKSPSDGWTGKAHFFAVAAKAMRQILIRHARDKRAEKRGGGAERVTLLDHDAAGRDATVELDVLALEEALNKLAELDERQAQVVELRYFGGLSVDEIASVMSVSPRTVELDWRMARAWLTGQLSE